MDDLLEHLKKAIFGKRARQATMLYASLAFALLVGVGASMINTRYLGKEGYGDFSFIQSLFLFLTSFATLGLFVTGSRLLARASDPETERNLMGALLVFGGLASAGMTVILLGFSFFSDGIFHNGLAPTIRIFAPLAFIFPLQMGLGALLQGENMIFRLSLLRALPLGLYLPVVLVYTRFTGLTLHAALGIRYTVLAVLTLGLAWSLKPTFLAVRHTLRTIWRENRGHGIHVYWGNIASMATTQLGALLIALYVDSSALGLYALATTVSNPLLLLTTVVATTFFRQFANSGRIPRALFAMTILSSAASLAGFLLVIRFFLEIFYPPEFIETVPLAYILALAATLSGLASFIDRFLNARGQGRSLRNISVLIGAATLLGYVFLIRQFGATGAAVTDLIGGCMHLMLSYLIYRAYVARQAQTAPPAATGAP